MDLIGNLVNACLVTTMDSFNTTYAELLDRLAIRIPELLLPRPGLDLSRWAVVACDQYTSDDAYWQRLQSAVGSAPSALKLVLPEIYLGREDVELRVSRIHAAMRQYLDDGLLQERGESLVYVRRTTKQSEPRQGLVVALDLERYDFSPGSKSLVRATEGTIVDRIPPRLAVRRDAPIELPHIMVLVQDPRCEVIEGCEGRMGELEPLYDIELMEGGGRLTGHRITSATHVAELLGGLDRLLAETRHAQGTDRPLFWAMGDGNHSLATAKARWDETKLELQADGLDGESLADHPARWALVEIVNLHSPGLRFEPIHRAVFTSQRDSLGRALRGDGALGSLREVAEQELKAVLEGPDGQASAGYFDGERFYLLRWKRETELPTAQVDRFFEAYRGTDAAARIDFIHGWEDTKKLGAAGAACFFLPVMARERLFDYVEKNGPLPRKSFSMGDAEEKRYYVEARRIRR